jgi:hypothetical protein
MTVALLFALAVTALSGMATLAVEEGQGPLAGIVTSASLPAWAEEDDDHDEYGEHGEGGEAFEEIHEFAANATLLLDPAASRGCRMGQPRPWREPRPGHDRRAQAKRRMTLCGRALTGFRPQARRRDAGNIHIPFLLCVGLRASPIPTACAGRGRP